METSPLANNPLLEKTLTEARANVKNGEIKKAYEATEKFESLFATMLLQSMRKAMIPDGFFGSGTQGDIFQGMMEQRLSEVIAKRNQLGIAAMMRKQLNIPEMNDFMKLPDAEEMQKIIQDAAQENGLDPQLIESVIEQESGGNPFVVSDAGAKGMMQLMDTTAKELNVNDVFNMRENIRAGSRYLKQQLDEFGSLELALAAYNAGPNAVKKYNGIPPFEETENYVRSILAKVNQKQAGSEKEQP